MLKFNLSIESETEGVVFEATAESFDILSDKFFAFERHHQVLFAEDEVKEF